MIDKHKYPDEKIDLCAKQINIFSSLLDNELKDIVSMIVRKEFKKGKNLCEEGEICDSLFLIREGIVKLSKITNDGKEQILHILVKGDFFGDTNLFSELESNYTATALSDTKICILSKTKFDEVIKRNPDILIKIVKSLSQRLVSVEELAKVLSTKNVESRISELLIKLITEHGYVTNNEYYIKLPISKLDMANYCGITRETMSRKLSKLENEQIIELRGNREIVIKDINSLKALVNADL